MSVASVGTPTQALATTGSITATWGTSQNRTAGHLLVAVLSATGTTSTAAMSTPSGWTKQLEIGNTTTAHARVAVYTKIAAGSDTAPAFTSTISGTATMNCTMFELSGASGVIDTSGTYASGSTAASLTAMTATSSANVTYTGEFAIATFAQEATAATNTWNGGSGWTNAATDGTTSSTGHTAVDFKSSPTSGATASEAGHWTTNATAYGAGLVIVFIATGAAISTLVDTFMGGSMNASLWTSFNGGNFSWASSELSISNVSGTSVYSGLTSVATYNLTSGALYVHLINAGNQSIVSWQCAIVLQANSSNVVDYLVGGNTLVAQATVAGTSTPLSSTAYNSSTMQWLRVREASGTMYFDYSADGNTWVNWYSHADPIAVTTLTIVVECGTYATETLVTTGIWQDLNSTTAPPITLTNNFEGGTSGTTITTANSGGTGGNAFDTVSIGTGDTAVFSKTHAAHGNFGGDVSTGSAGNPVYFGWNSSIGTQTTLYGRAYLYLTALPALVDNIVSFQSSGTQILGIQISTSGILDLYDYTTSAAIHTFTSVIPLGQWVRIEWFVTFSATVGQVTLNYYSPMDTTTATETYASAATLNLGTSCNTVYFGWIAGKANQPVLYFDDIGLSNTGYLGPAAVASAASGGGSALVYNNFEGGTSGTTITTANSGGTSGTAFTTITIATTASATFSNTHAAHGNLSLAVATGTTSSNALVQWGSAAVGTLTTVYGRAYFYLTAAPTSSDAVVQFQTSGTWACGIQITTGRQLLMQDAAFATVHTFTNVIPTGQWVRVEWKLVFSATVGQVVLNYYASMDSTTVTETYTSAATQNFGASSNTVLFGWTGSHISQPTTYIDDIALSITGFLGPATLGKSSAFMVFFA